ncbi:NPCC-domain-containing protein [Xylariaceae sp. FL1272]|nr:NPCC-domain-containing protein [Xylariaceae sp. FL1272]
MASKTVLSTPTKTPAEPVTDSPGTWRHPRLQEITRRQEACTFTDRNIKHIAINAALIFLISLLHTTVCKYLPSRRSAPHIWNYEWYAFGLLLLLPLFNIAYNLWPLIRAKDDLSDIPLTPAQRQLLGLPPSSAPPTPGSVFSTPPRYSRTPSVGSAASRRSFSSSPLSNQASPTPAGNGSPGFASPNHHLLQKAMFGARRSSRGSIGSPGSPLGVSTGTSLFGGGLESPSPSPSPGKRSSVALSSKWRYEKGLYDKNSFRDSIGNTMYT